MSTEKIPSRRLRCRDKHPTMVKLMKVYDLMEELGLRISFHGSTTTVQDEELATTVPFFWLEDVGNPDDRMGEFPPATEFCLFFTNPAYTAHHKKINDERKAEEKRKKVLAEQKKKEKEEKDALRAAERNAERVKAEEEKERNLLKKLKEKYESA